MKKLLLSLLLIGSVAQAHVPALCNSSIARFPLEEKLARLYLDVTVEEPRIIMQKLSEEFLAWIAMVKCDVTTKKDSLYLSRMCHMFGEVMVNYRYGV